jgi:two-component system osmolarity sensor histidine kinase EnvZ
LSLFARSFLLIAALIVTAVLASFQLYRMYEREPRSRELAQQAVSAVNLTRAALVSADPYRRRQLLIDINESEGLRLYPATSSEALRPVRPGSFLDKVAGKIRAELGPQTRFATARDGERGFWVSFFIDVDEYWINLPRERFEVLVGLRWLGWGGGLLALALAGAWLIAFGIARPLRHLTRAAGRVGRGEAHESLPEEGARELRELAAAFNRMARDLASMERERAMVLAGISHDLRSPLSRLRLALEMSGPDAEATQAMIADIDEIDAVIGQFLDYARGESEQKLVYDLNRLLLDLAGHYARIGRKVVLHDEPVPAFAFATMGVRRAVANLVDNALRYAGEPVEIRSYASRGKAIVEVGDRGPGIPASETERMKRPFTRLDAARTRPGGSGLGLAIVERVARAHGGALDLLAREGGGLLARLTLDAGSASGGASTAAAPARAAAMPTPRAPDAGA